MSDRQKPSLTPRLAPRLDLGLGALVPAWRKAIGGATLRDDILAGFAAVGPSFALALLVAQHAGLPTTAPLTCAVVGSAIVALLGGTTIGLSGPGLALGFALVEIVRDYGAAGLALAGAMCGVFQLLLGMLRVGRFARLVPLSAVHGFALGLGVLLVIQSLPHVLGLATPVDLDALHVIDHLGAHITSTRLPAVGMAAFTCAATLLGTRYVRRAPAAILAVAACAAFTSLGHFDVPTLPDMPLVFPLGPAPGVPDRDVAQFLGAALVLFALATTETLLSAVAEEERVPGTRDDLDQELIGHGLANMVLALLGSVPAAGSIARAAAMRVAGGRTRAAALIHALCGAALVPVILYTDHFVPLAALAGVVVALAVPLLDRGPVLAVMRVSRSEAIVLVVTAFVFVFGSLSRGVEVGLAAALALAMLRVARFRVTIHRGKGGSPHQVNFSGPITFLSAPSLEGTRSELAALDPAAGIILDMRNVPVMDMTGCQRFLSLLGDVVDRGVRVVVLGVSPRCHGKLVAGDRQDLLTSRLAVSDRDVDVVLGQARAFGMRAHVIANLERFRVELRDHYTPLFAELADGQHPHTLFVTCVDSRITPAMLTGAHPGELFILRCLGAMVTPPGETGLFAEGAAIEYAVGVLGVRNIVVCGHSRCGAVQAVKSGRVPDELSSLKRWLKVAPQAAGDLSGYADADDAGRAVVVRQLDNLRQFSLVRDRLEKGEIELHGWFYDVGQAELFEWNEAKKAFSVLGGGGSSASQPPPPPEPEPA